VRGARTRQQWLPVKITADPSPSSGFPGGLGGFGEPHAAFPKAAYVVVDESGVVGNP
jgi:hypothetical protein